nr:antibiotic biosynthesis monooxygenase [Pseudanabaena sp. FACHB-2040]
MVTLINVHVCKPEDQQQLADLLVEGVNTIYRHVPGFISASIHKSLDGVRVTNYAQYRSREDIDAVWSNPDVGAFAQKVGKFVESFDAHLYEVIEVATPDPEQQIS